MTRRPSATASSSRRAPWPSGCRYGRSATRRAIACCGSCGAGTGSVVTWRRAQMVLLSAQGDGRGPDRAGDLHQRGSRPRRDPQLQRRRLRVALPALPRAAGRRRSRLPERRQIKQIALSRPADHGLPFSTWSLAKLADFLVAEGVVEDISHEGLRSLLARRGGVLSSA